jgi:hypothetical protein
MIFFHFGVSVENQEEEAQTGTVTSLEEKK